MTGGDHREEGGPDLAAVGVEGKFVQKDIGGKAPSRVRVGGQGRDPRTVWKLHLQGLIACPGGLVVRLEALDDAAQSLTVTLDPFLHGLLGLALAAGEDHPARPPAVQIRQLAILRHLKCGGEGFSGLPGEHADFEPAFVDDPALLIWIEDSAH